MREGGVVGDDATESGRDVKRSRMETAQAQSEEKRGDVHMQSSEQRGSCGEEVGCIYFVHARTDKFRNDPDSQLSPPADNQLEDSCVDKSLSFDKVAAAKWVSTGLFLGRPSNIGYTYSSQANDPLRSYLQSLESFFWHIGSMSQVLQAGLRNDTIIYQ